MPFSITTKDGITINNIPDDVAPDADILKSRVAVERRKRMDAQITMQRQAQPAFTREDPGFFRTIEGELELGATILSGAILEPFAGAAGILAAINPFLDPGAGARTVESIRSLAFTPGREGQAVARSVGEIAKLVTPDVVKDFIGLVGTEFKETQEEIFQKYGPVAGTAFSILPIIVLEAIPGAFALKKARGLRTTIADEVIEESGDAARAAGENTIKTGIPPEAKDYQTLADDVRAQNTENLIGEVRADPATVQSAKNLGIDLNPSHFSTNQKFIEMEQALKADPKSGLGAIEEAAILRTGEKADELIKELGGNVDKSLLDESVLSDIKLTLADLEKDAAKAYNKVNQVIPPEIQVKSNASRAYIEKRLFELGDDDFLLNKSEKELARLLGILPKKKLKPGEIPIVKTPTYSGLDQVRRNVGEAEGNQRGPFKDDEDRILKQVYGVLSEDQQGVADFYKVGTQYQDGRKLVQTRKELEGQALNLFGRDLRGSIIPKLKTAAGKITKGDISGFRNLMNDLPAGKRQEAAATLLNEFFTSGGRKGRAIGAGFESAFEALNRFPSLKKTIFDELPPQALKTFDDLGRVATGIFKARKFGNVSGTGRAVIAAMQKGEVFNKILDSKITRTGGRFVPGGNIALDIFGSVIRKGNEEGLKKAVDFISSPAFRKSLEDAALGNAVTAEKIINTKAMKEWLTAQPPDIQTEIAAIGFIPWLVPGEETVNINVSTEELRRRNR